MHKTNEIRIYLCLPPLKSDIQGFVDLRITFSSFGFFSQTFCVYIAIFFAKPQKYSQLAPQSQHIFGYFHFSQKFYANNPISLYRLVNRTVCLHIIKWETHKKIGGLRFYC